MSQRAWHLWTGQLKVGCCPGAWDPKWRPKGFCRIMLCSSELDSQYESRYFCVFQLSLNEPMTWRACFCGCVLVGVSREFSMEQEKNAPVQSIFLFPLQQLFHFLGPRIAKCFFVILTVICRKPKPMNSTCCLFQYSSVDHRIQVFWNWYFS